MSDSNSDAVSRPRGFIPFSGSDLDRHSQLIKRQAKQALIKESELSFRGGFLSRSLSYARSDCLEEQEKVRAIEIADCSARIRHHVDYFTPTPEPLSSASLCRRSFSITSPMVKLAGRCLGGNSTSVCIYWPTSAPAGISIKARSVRHFA
jgi:hypothetical protein